MTILGFGNVLYLTRHNFTIDTTDLNANIEACFVMGIHNITAPGFVSSSSTIIGSLWACKGWHIRKMQQHLNP
jgi:hypothetical protein